MSCAIDTRPPPNHQLHYLTATLLQVVLVGVGSCGGRQGAVGVMPLPILADDLSTRPALSTRPDFAIQTRLALCHSSRDPSHHPCLGPCRPCHGPFGSPEIQQAFPTGPGAEIEGC